MWAVTWQGGALVRLGVSRQDPTGLSWAEVAPPAPECPLSVVAVGAGVVWAVARGGAVWARQGVRAGEGGAQLARGTRWVKLGGEVATLTVGPGDQLLAVGCGGQDRPLLLREGVTREDLTGRGWVTLTAGVEPASQLGSQEQQHTRAMAGLHLSDSESEASPISESHASVSQGASPDQEGSLGSRLATGTGQRMMQGVAAGAVGAVARATVGRLPVAGPVLASAVTGAMMEEINKEISKPKVNTL